MKSKYSASLSFLLNSFKSSFDCSVLPMGGVGVNLKPLFSKVFFCCTHILLGKMIILMSFIPVSKRGWGLGVFDLDPEPGLDPSPCLAPDPDPKSNPDLKNTVVHFVNLAAYSLWVVRRHAEFPVVVAVLLLPALVRMCL